MVGLLGVVLSAGAARAATTHVHIQGFAFLPAAATVAIGSLVSWDNHDGVLHTVTSDTGLFDSGALGNGASFSLPFGSAGSFPYHCAIHATMRGEIRVVSSSAPDVVVDAFDASGNGLPEIQIRLVARNAGIDPTGAFRARIAYRYKGSLHTIADVDFPSLSSDQSAERRITWNTLGKIGNFTLRASTDSEGQVAELDETNNAAERTVSILVPVPGVDLLDP